MASKNLYKEGTRVVVDNRKGKRSDFYKGDNYLYPSFQGNYRGYDNKIQKHKVSIGNSVRDVMYVEGKNIKKYNKSKSNSNSKKKPKDEEKIDNFYSSVRLDK